MDSSPHDVRKNEHDLGVEKATENSIQGRLEKTFRYLFVSRCTPDKEEQNSSWFIFRGNWEKSLRKPRIVEKHREVSNRFYRLASRMRATLAFPRPGRAERLLREQVQYQADRGRQSVNAPQSQTATSRISSGFTSSQTIPTKNG
jgi:hypothetical protein